MTTPVPVDMTFADRAPPGADDSSQRMLSMIVLVVFHVLVWWCVYGLARSNLDAQGDMVETFAWGQSWQWGYWKHPPLSSWVSGAWFTAMPQTDVSYALLASVNAAVGLLGVHAMAREFVDRRWMVACTAAAALTPGLTILAMRFNANALLLSTWPWAIACFARAMRTGQLRHAMAAGVTCALAMLAKYFSAVLLASLLMAALLHAPWRARLLSRCGVLMVLSGTLILLPHAWWLATHGAPPLRYAAAATGAQGSPLLRALIFVLIMLVFPLFSIALLWFAAPRRAAGDATRLQRLRSIVGRVFQPSTDPLWIIAWGPLVLTVCATVFASTRTASLWGLAMSFALIVLATRGACAVTSHPELRKVWTGLVTVWLLALVTAPLVWDQGARRGERGQTEPRAELAAELEAQWLQRYNTPLKWVSGTAPLAMSASFYSRYGMQYWNSRIRALDTPWVDEARVTREGHAMLCDPRLDPDCQLEAQRRCGTVRTITAAKHTRGYTFEPQDFVVAFCAPSP